MRVGITLIALVITIIVLLILAGVSIAMLTGNNGILTQARRAKTETENAATNEMARLDEYNQIMDDWINGENSSGEEDKPTIDENNVKIRLKDEDLGQYISGGIIKIYSDENLENLIQTVEFTNGETEKEVKLPIGKCYLKMIEAPNGYQLISEAQEFVVEENKENIFIFEVVSNEEPPIELPSS